MTLDTDQPIVWRENLGLRGLTALQVTFDEVKSPASLVPQAESRDNRLPVSSGIAAAIRNAGTRFKFRRYACLGVPSAPGVPLPQELRSTPEACVPSNAKRALLAKLLSGDIDSGTDASADD